MTFRCIICKKIKDKKEESPEHIIPETLGCSLQISNVCKTCNNKILAKVDAKLVDSWPLKIARVIRGIKTKNGKLPTFDFGKSMVIKDTQIKAHYIISKGNQSLKYWGKWREEDTMHLVLEGEDFLKIDYEELKKKYVIQGIKETSAEINFDKDPVCSEKVMGNVKQKLESILDLIKVEEKEELNPVLQAQRKISIYDHQPAIVKIAFEFAVLKLGEAYAFSDDAEILRKFVLEEDFEKRKELKVNGRIFPSISSEEPLNYRFEVNKDYHAIIFITNFVWIYLFGQVWGIISIFERTPENIKKYTISDNSAIIMLADSLTKKCREMKYIQGLQKNSEDEIHNNKQEN